MVNRPGLACDLAVKLLAEGAPVELEVSGRSMMPWIRAGDVVRVRPLPPDRRTPRVGEVVAWSPAPGRLLLHRVISIRGDRLRTRGDAAPAADPWISNGEVLGTVIEVRRGRRRVRWGVTAGVRLLAPLSRMGAVRLAFRMWRRLAHRGRPRVFHEDPWPEARGAAHGGVLAPSVSEGIPVPSGRRAHGKTSPDAAHRASGQETQE